MWGIAYVLLLPVRFYFALSTSYIHPDEHFQGPEVVAGELFNWHSQRTWEFTSNTPIRSFFPLWLTYGLPLKAAQWLSPEPLTPSAAFTFLRLSFLAFSLLFEDWAFYKLIPDSRRKGWGLALLASSYVTWTFQTHTFSNSIETILVLTALVLMQHIRRRKSAPISSALLGFVCVFGTFNRITFPAFIVLPGLGMLHKLLTSPSTFIPLTLAAAITAAYAIQLDTEFYQGTQPVITPLNNLIYNTQTSNLAQHGLHPRITHLLVNLPQLLGPALILFVMSASGRYLTSLPILSAVSGVAVLSILPHQEARFLIPCVPLILSQVSLPRWKGTWLASWVLFNLALGMLMGVYHQGGIVPAQVFLGTRTNATDILYWKTYMPPTWLLGPWTKAVDIVDVPSSLNELVPAIERKAARCGREVYLVAPLSATQLDPLVDDPGRGWSLDRVWVTRRHLNLDDLDIGEEGAMGTVERVLGRRGLGIWKVNWRSC
ncbi:GPI mannosyltransferase 4 [Coprinopsis cinerea AmutBmut pab1-1]|nr:GPI mannosyltransferase 4 [Coprinopsis cinerea AmutBmut pab1-1]